MSDPVSRPLRDALSAGDQTPTPQITAAVVEDTSTASSPHTVSLRMPDGLLVPDLTYPGWWSPRVGDVATVVTQGGVVTILHAVAPCLTVVAPHRHKTEDIDGYVIPAPPTPPPPPTPTPAPPTVVTRTVQPTDMGSWGGASFNQNQMIQGGPAHDAFWFYGDGIAAAKGSGTITGGTIYVQRLATAHGVGGAANVRLGVHGYTGRPGAAGGVTTAEVVAQLNRGQGVAVPLTAAHVAALNAGAKGLGLAHGSASYTSADYLRALATAPSGALSLTIQT